MHGCDYHPDLHSFPTRRSSDLGKGKLTLTGKLGDVMQESAHAAMSYTRSRAQRLGLTRELDRKSRRLNSSHVRISYAVFCLKKKTEYPGIGLAHCTQPHAASSP